jgi:small ligand-binding sensory domain FIST
MDGFTYPMQEQEDSVDHHHVVLLPRATTESVSSLLFFSYSSLDGTSVVGGMVSHAHTILGLQADKFGYY